MQNVVTSITSMIRFQRELIILSLTQMYNSIIFTFSVSSDDRGEWLFTHGTAAVSLDYLIVQFDLSFRSALNWDELFFILPDMDVIHWDFEMLHVHNKTIR